MTTIIFFTDKKKRTSGFICRGHSGYAEEGSDIVCAAVTSAVRLAEYSLSAVISPVVSVDEEDAAISMSLPPLSSSFEEEYCQTFLASLRSYFEDLTEEFPDYIEISSQNI